MLVLSCRLLREPLPRMPQEEIAGDLSKGALHDEL